MKDLLEVISYVHMLPISEIIKLHQKIADITIKKDGDAYNGGEYLTHTILNLIENKYMSEEICNKLQNFFNTKYFSNYYKKYLLKNEKINEFPELKKLLTSNKELTDFTKEEFKKINEFLKSIKKDTYYIDMLLQLNSKGANDFLDQEIDQLRLMKTILKYSGVPSYEIYYFRNDIPCSIRIDGYILNKVYRQLYKINPAKAFVMGRVVIKQPILDGKSFLKNMLILGETKYDTEHPYIRNIFESNLIVYPSYENRNDDTFRYKSGFLDYLTQKDLRDILAGEDYVEISGGKGCAHYPISKHHVK